MANGTGAVDLWSWGWGEFGMLGHGDSTSVQSPQSVRALQGKRVVAIACGSHHTIALTDVGEVYTWGWGSDGQLGQGTFYNNLSPTTVRSLHGRKIVGVACGYYHTLALTESGEVFSWGKGSNGQLGHGEVESEGVPRTIQQINGVKVTHISCGHSHSLVVAEGSHVFAWGCGGNGQLGLGRDVVCNQLLPVEIESLQGCGVGRVACGANHSMALTDAGMLYTWGLADDGRLGHGSAQIVLGVPTPVQTLESTLIVEISAGTHHSAALSDGGQLYTWGRGSYGQLGHGDNETVHVPTPVTGLAGHAFRVSCGDCHTVVVTEEGDVLSFGSGEDGQLGHDNHNSYTIPKVVKQLTGKGVSEVSCGLCHTVALRGLQGLGGSDSTVTLLEEKLRQMTLKLQNAELHLQSERRARIMAERRLGEVTQQLAHVQSRAHAQAARVSAGSASDRARDTLSTSVGRAVATQTDVDLSTLSGGSNWRRKGSGSRKLTTRLGEELQLLSRPLEPVNRGVDAGNVGDSAFEGVVNGSGHGGDVIDPSQERANIMTRATQIMKTRPSDSAAHDDDPDDGDGTVGVPADGGASQGIGGGGRAAMHEAFLAFGGGEPFVPAPTRHDDDTDDDDDDIISESESEDGSVDDSDGDINHELVGGVRRGGALLDAQHDRYADDDAALKAALSASRRTAVLDKVESKMGKMRGVLTKEPAAKAKTYFKNLLSDLKDEMKVTDGVPRTDGRL